MAIQHWSDNIVVVTLADDPQFSEDLSAVNNLADERKDIDVALNFSDVTFINSSNLAKLLRLRKAITANSRKLVLCGIPNSVWSVFLVTGLDRLFTFEKEIATGLARLTMLAS